MVDQRRCRHKGTKGQRDRDVFLDDNPSERAVRRQLQLLVHLSESREFVIGIGHVYPTTIGVLKDEIPKLSAAGYEFLFASDVLR